MRGVVIYLCFAKKFQQRVSLNLELSQGSLAYAQGWWATWLRAGWKQPAMRCWDSLRKNHPSAKKIKDFWKDKAASGGNNRAICNNKTSINFQSLVLYWKEVIFNLGTCTYEDMFMSSWKNSEKLIVLQSFLCVQIYSPSIEFLMYLICI